MTEGGYIYSPAGNTIAIKHAGTGDATLFAYKRRYVAVDGYSAHTVVANINDNNRGCHMREWKTAIAKIFFRQQGTLALI